MAYAKRSYRKKSWTKPSMKRARTGVRSKTRYATRWQKADKFSTLSNTPSALPAQLRPGQGGYSRAAFARAAVRSDLEVKNIDTVNAKWNVIGTTTATGVTTLASGTIYATELGSICRIPQNSTANGRVGRKAVLKGIESRFTFTLATGATAAATNATVRLITVLDRQANGLPFADIALFTLGTSKVTSLYNLDNAQRFTILSDEEFDLNSQAVITSNSIETVKARTIKMAVNIPVEFGGTDGTLAEIKSNNVLHICVVSGGGSVEARTMNRVYFVG